MSWPDEIVKESKTEQDDLGFVSVVIFIPSRSFATG